MNKRTCPRMAVWKERDSTRSPCLRLVKRANAGGIAMIATSAGFAALALISRTDPIPWMVSKACNLRRFDSIRELVDVHARVPLTQPSIGVQWLKRNLQHRRDASVSTRIGNLGYSLTVMRAYLALISVTLSTFTVAK